MVAQDYAFYCDVNDQYFYIHFEGDTYLLHNNIFVGRAYTIANRSQNISGRMRDKLGVLNYDTVLDESSINDIQEAEKIGENQLVFNDLTFAFFNVDGRFDDIRPKIIGQNARVYLSETEEEIELEDLTLIRWGVTDSVKFTNGEVQVTMADPRSYWSNKVDTGFLGTTEYPSIGDEYIDKYKPLCLGDQPIYNVPVVQITGTTFLVSTTDFGATGSIIAAKLDGETISPANYSYDAGTGVLTYATYSSGEIMVDLNPVDKGNLVEMLIWFLETFENIEYIESNFNLTEIEEVISASLSGSIYLNTDGVILSDILDQITRSANVRLLPQDSVYTIRDIRDRTPIATLDSDVFTQSPNNWEYDDQEYFSSITCQYKKDWKESEYQTRHDDSREEEAYNNNGQYRVQEVPTLLIDSDDVDTWIATRYDRSVFAPVILKGLRILSSVMGYSLLDYVIYMHKRNGKEILSAGVYEIISISKTKRILGLRYIEEYDSIEDNTTSFDFMQPLGEDVLDFMNSSSESLSFDGGTL